MNEKILTVEDSFLIQQRGLVIVGIKEKNSPAIKIGSRVEIIQPNGTKIFSEISGIEIISRKCFADEFELRKVGFMMKNLKKEDIPNGSEIFLIN